MDTRVNFILAGRRRRPAAALGLAIVAALAMAAAPALGGELLDRVIAVVSGTVITLSDARTAIQFGLVDTRDEKDPVASAMQWLVDRQLVLDEVNRYETTDGDIEQVNTMYAGIRKRLAAGPGADATFALLGLDEAGAKRFVRDTVRVQQYLRRRFESIAPGSDSELRAHYAADPRRFARDGQVPSFEAARTAVEQSYQEMQRTKSVAAWLDRLRRRAEVNELYVAIR